MRRHLWLLTLLLPVASCLAIYHSALRTWFFMDDYAWLGMWDEIHDLPSLFQTLFRPQAQGTVRVFSERIPFILFRAVFGIDVAPFRVLTFVTQFANIVLLALVTRELTRSRLAAVAAPILWVANSALLVPLSWVSCYNEVLFAFCLLGAFYCFLRHTATGDRRFLIAQWTLYLFGFGVLELNVLYPALVLLYTFCCARHLWRKSLPLFIPAILYTAIHFTFIPRSAGTPYRMFFDPASLFGMAWRYLTTGLGPTDLWMITGPIIAATLAFVLLRVWRRDYLPLFLLGWFFLILGPVLPLKNHFSEYYLAVPTIGFAMLAGYAFALSWRYRAWTGSLATLLAAVYAAGMIAQSQPVLEWRRVSSQRLRTLLEATAKAKERHPSAGVILLHDVSWDVYTAGFNDQPFRLYGLDRVFLTPTNYDSLDKSGQPLRGLMSYHISSGEAARALESGYALVLQPTANGVRNVTTVYKGIALAQYKPAPPTHIDVGLPSSESDLGPTWYPIENGFRWMPGRATVRMATPKLGERLYLRGFVPKMAVAAGPLTFTVRANGDVIGSAKYTRGDEQLALDFPFLPVAHGKDLVEIELSVDHTFRQGSDLRDLGLIFGALEIK